MSLQTLELVMKLKTGEVNTGLNTIESKVESLISRLRSFSDSVKASFSGANTQIQNISATISNIGEINAVSEDQISRLVALEEALKMTDRYSGLVNERNIEAIKLNSEALALAEDNAAALRDQGVAVSDLIKAAERHARLSERIGIYYTKVGKEVDSHRDLINGILNDNVKITRSDLDRVKNLKNITKQLKTISGVEEDIFEHFKLTKEQIQKIDEHAGRLETQLSKAKDNSAALAKLSPDIIPGASKLLSVVKLFDFMVSTGKELVDTFEKNRAIVNDLMPGIEGTTGLYAKLAKQQAAVTSGAILWSEAQEALTATLSNGIAILAKSDKQITNFTKDVALTARATGAAEQDIARLGVVVIGLTDSVGDGREAVKAITGAMAELGVTTANTQSSISALTDGLASARTFLRPDQIKEYQAGVSLLASAASQAGLSAQSSQRMFNQFVDPIERLNNAALLARGGLQNLTEASPEQMLRAAASAAADVQRKFEKGQITAAEYSAMLSTMKIDTQQAQVLVELNKQLEQGKMAGKDFVQVQNDLAKAGEAAANNMPTDSTREFQKVVDQLKVTLTPILIGLNKMGAVIASILQNDFARWVLIGAAALVAWKRVVGPLLGTLGKFIGFAKETTSVMTSMAKVKNPGSGGNIATFAKNFQQATVHFAKVNWLGLAKAAVSLAAFGASLAVGVAALGLAVRTFPPDRAVELGISVAGIVAAAKILQMVDPAMSLKGAVGLIAIGAALSASVALLGMAVKLMPPDQLKTLGLVTAGLLATTGILALLGPLIVPALIGAVGLVGVASALALSVYLLGKVSGSLSRIGRSIGSFVKAIRGISPKAGVALASLAVGITAFAGAMVGTGFADLLSGGLDEQATKLGRAMIILEQPISKMAALSPNAGTALQSIGKGLGEMSSGLTGGLLDFARNTDFAATAQKLAVSMIRLAEPVKAIAAVGAEGGQAFRDIARGMSDMSETLKGSIFDVFRGDVQERAKQLYWALNELAMSVGHFASVKGSGQSFFEMAKGIDTLSAAIDRGIDLDDAKELAKSMNQYILPVWGNMMRMEQNKARIVSEARIAAASATARAFAEEIKSSIEVRVEAAVAGDAQSEITERLDAILESLNEIGANRHLEKITKTVSRLLDEQLFGGSAVNFGSSSANNQYT